MSNIHFLNKNAVRNRYGAMLAAIHARLAEVAAKHTSAELDSYKFVRERGRGLLPDVTPFRYAQTQAEQFQAQFNSVDWHPQSNDLYWLKLGVEVLSSMLQSVSAVRGFQEAPPAAVESSAYAMPMAA